jgi:PleD family two-component response regulator
MSSRELKSVQGDSGETAPTAGPAIGPSIETQKKILIIDDDPITVKALTVALTSKGYATYSAKDGSEAIAAIRGRYSGHGCQFRAQ